ncbi:MAG: dihydropyrimidinase [Bacteroidales bacterium]|nr:dihydropyrimidinase [Bacteroidales bacterium]
MSILIKNGRIVTAADDYIADIYIENEKIKTIGHDLPFQADQIINADNKIIFPGGIDPHVHLEMPFKETFSSDNYETGTRAALFGGTTTVIDFITQKKEKSLFSALEEWKGRSTGNTLSDYAFHMSVTDFNENTRGEIRDLIEKEGITSFKIFMAYRGSLMVDDRQIAGLMDEVKKYGGIVSAHATNGDLIDYLVAKNKAEGRLSPLYHYLSQPEITEAEATGRFVDIALQSGIKPYVVHLSCEGALNRVRNATVRNQKIFAETCIQYLILDASVYNRGFESAKWVMSPPVREKKDQTALWSGIEQGLIHTVASDHCPFTWEQKMMGEKDFSKIPNGAAGIENRMELLFSEGVAKNRITLNQYVELTATNAARIFGMYPQKGTIAVGSDADLVVFDPGEKHVLSAKTHHMNCDYSEYEGMEITGKCKTVLLRGKMAIDKNKIWVEKGYGKFIKRNIPE